ncbi:hypothetical protein [Candidatus Amarolinea dominans]|uniref:hypothetical protein n=1 Tax=Candidatus Amarolinea dominans TaxID=3140696 RepID=UPI0031368F42|nr:hypothetical protein [Anaerolineae bacterium]
MSQKTFGAMAEEAYRVVPTIKPADLQRRQKKEADLLVIDVRDAAFGRHRPDRDYCGAVEICR